MRTTIVLIITFFLAGSLFGQHVNAQSAPNKVDEKGRKQGPWIKKYPGNAVPQYKGQFKDDKPQGTFYFYYESGQLKAKVEYQNNGKFARSTMYHEEGEVMGKGNYVDQKKDSVWTYYDRKNFVSMREPYKVGKLDGKKTIYYNNKNGKEKIAEEIHFKEGVAHGEWKQYFENGVVKAEGKYVDGNFDGLVNYYHSNGKISYEKRYKAAVLHGWQRAYDEKGKLLDEKLYLYNRLIKGKELEEFKKRHNYVDPQNR